MRSSRHQKFSEKSSPCGAFFSEKIMKFSWKNDEKILHNFATSKKSTSLDEKNDSIKPHIWGWGVKFLKKRPCGALFLPTCTTPPPVIIFFRRGLDRNFRQVKKFCIPIYQKMHIFHKKKKSTLYHRGWYRGRKMGVFRVLRGIPGHSRGFGPFFGSKFSSDFHEIFRKFSLKKLKKIGKKSEKNALERRENHEKKWPWKWVKISWDFCSWKWGNFRR